MAETRYVLKVYGVQVATLPPAKIGSIVDIECAPFCNGDAKRLASNMCDAHGFLNMVDSTDRETKNFFLMKVPLWAACIAGLGCFLVGAGVWKPPNIDTMKKIRTVASAVEEIAAIVKEMVAGGE